MAQPLSRCSACLHPTELEYGLQHVMSMYAGVVAVPLIVGSATKLSFSDLSHLSAATLLISGLATLLQTLGVFSRLLRFFPPVVTGSVITGRWRDPVGTWAVPQGRGNHRGAAVAGAGWCGSALFGTVAASGIRSLSGALRGQSESGHRGAVDQHGIIPIAVPDFYEEFPSWFQTIFASGISAAAVTAVLFNILFNVLGRKDNAAPIFAEGPAPGVTPEYQSGRHAPHGPETNGPETNGPETNGPDTHGKDRDEH